MIVEIGYITEGPTDQRFLLGVIEKTVRDICEKSNTHLELPEPRWIKMRKEDGYEKNVIATIKGIMEDYPNINIICLHADADAPSEATVMKNKINKVFELIKSESMTIKPLVLIIPVQMTEAWMLADVGLLAAEMGTTISINALMLPSKPRQIEAISDPKSKIEQSILIAKQSKPKRRRDDLHLSYLYSPIGVKITVAKLMLLPSFQKFYERLKKGLEEINGPA